MGRGAWRASVQGSQRVGPLTDTDRQEEKTKAVGKDFRGVITSLGDDFIS